MKIRSIGTSRCGLLSLVTILWATSVCFSQESKHDLEEDVFAENINDSTRVQVKLKYDKEGTPQYYFCHVNTAVCEDGLCKLMVVDVFWDLLGNFLRYELPAGEALTKMDHKEFTKEDHEKLRNILSSKTSILKDYPLKDLIVKPTGRKSGDVDAVTAATRADVRDVVVGGAVYSTYVLWHIVNGPIALKIEEHSRPFLTEERVARMFYSENFYYQYFALNSLADKDPAKYAEGVVHLVMNGTDYIPYFAIDKVPATALQKEKYQVALLQHFVQSDFELQNAILNRMAGVKLSSEALSLLVAALDKVTDRQAIKALEIVAVSQDNLNASSRKTLSQFARNKDPQISERVQALLTSNKETDKKRVNSNN